MGLNEEENTVYCIAGDMFRGSIIDSEYKGISTIEIVNMLAPDVVSLGNHEVDYGIAHLLFIEKLAKFPIINCNLYVKSNHARLFRSHYILDAGGLKILFIGILTEEVIAQTKQDSLIGSIVDVYEAAREVGRICDAYHNVDIDFTVLLTHIGFEEDKKLAATLDPAWGVDIIVGGHSHTVPEHPENINNILIVQAGKGADQIGRFDIIVDTDKNCIHSWQWQIVPIDDTHCPVDKDLEKLIYEFNAKTEEKYQKIITRFAKNDPSCPNKQRVGKFCADVVKDVMG